MGNDELTPKGKQLIEELKGVLQVPSWYEEKKEKRPTTIPVDQIDEYIQQNVVADTEIEVEDYVHRPNNVIRPGVLRAILFKDGRIALLTSHVGFFIKPEDVDFIAGLSQGQREKADEPE